MICPDSFQVINIRLIAISRDYLVEENSNTISHNSNKCSNRKLLRITTLFHKRTIVQSFVNPYWGIYSHAAELSRVYEGPCAISNLWSKYDIFTFLQFWIAFYFTFTKWRKIWTALTLKIYGQAKWRQRQNVCRITQRYFFTQTIVLKYMKSIYQINAEAITFRKMLTKPSLNTNFVNKAAWMSLLS